MKSRNKNGPNTDSCGTPLVMSRELESLLWHNTACPKRSSDIQSCENDRQQGLNLCQILVEESLQIISLDICPLKVACK